MERERLCSDVSIIREEKQMKCSSQSFHSPTYFKGKYSDSKVYCGKMDARKMENNKIESDVN